jgi:hypothetical protein
MSIILSVLQLLSLLSHAAPKSEEMVGSWLAVGYYYEDQFIQPPDPQLTLTFDFMQDGTHRLFWRMKGETTFCERKGTWHLKDDQLFIEATWVNPENGPQCSGDPDMQVGTKTQSPVSIQNEQLWIELPFGDSVMIYVWDPISLPIR